MKGEINVTTKTKKIIVNGLSLSRILGAFFVPLIFSSVSIPILITFLVFLFSTDFLDGMLARHWNVRTLGGSLLDPIGDKLLAVMCIFSLLNVHHKLTFLLVIEFLIVVLNIVRFTRGESVKVTIVGKVKTWALSITLVLASIEHFKPELLNIFASLLNLDRDLTITNSTIDVALYITIGLELATLVVYFSDSIKNRKGKKLVFKKKIDVAKFIKRAFDEKTYIEDKGKSIAEIIDSME